MHSHGAFQELREQRFASAAVVAAAAAEEHQQRERREREREALKRKDNCSANASPEVKQILSVSSNIFSFTFSMKQCIFIFMNELFLF